MKSIVIYYTLLGHNRDIAEEIAERENCDILEFAPGSFLRCFHFFLLHKTLKKRAKEVDIAEYNEIIICGPIWAAKPAAAIRFLLEALDLRGKTVKIYFTFTQNYGETESMIRELMEKRGANLIDIQFKNILKKTDGEA